MSALHLVRSEPASRKVLYIEDDRISITLLDAMIQNIPGTQLFTAEAAEEGLEIACRELPDIIFMDIELPGIDGITALGIIRENPDLADCKIHALSAHAMPHQVQVAMEAGFDTYITKPYVLEQITELVCG